MRGIAVHQDLTDDWQNSGAKTSLEFAILTNEISTGSNSFNDCNGLHGYNKRK